MKNLLTIKRSVLTEENDSCCLSTKVLEDEKEKEVNVRVKKEYGKYLCHERADALLIGLLPYALREGHDIVCEGYVTEDLMYNFEEILLPALEKNDERNHKVKITATTAPALNNYGAVGTGISCGVDSFHTILKNYKTNHTANNLTHLAINDVGAFNRIYLYRGIKYVKDSAFRHAEEVAEELQLPIVKLDSNFDKEFYLNHTITHTYSSMFAVYNLQKFWGKYYYASGYGYNDFSLKGNLTAANSHIDLLLLQCLSTSKLRLYSGGGDCTRMEKLEYISDFPITWKHLHVCIKQEKNCGVCDKCSRTLLSLETMGKLDKYKNVFDIDSYNKNKSFHYRHCCEIYALGDTLMKPNFDKLYPLHKEEFDKYLEEFTLKHQMREVEKQKNLAKRWENYAYFYKRIISEKDCREKILNYFSENNINKIAFYGNGEIFDFLYSTLLKTEIEISYLVEKNKTDVNCTIYPTGREEELPFVDLMIITRIIGVEDIFEMLKRTCNFEILTAKDFINKIF